MTEDMKVRENRVRRIAERRGFKLTKSRRRDPQAIDFNGYMLADAFTNAAVVGFLPYAYSASLDEVEEFLNSDRAAK